MLDEVSQVRLSLITPKGMTSLPLHIKIRDRIKQQQTQIEKFNKTSQKLALKPSDSTIQQTIAKILESLHISRHGYAKLLPEMSFANNTLEDHNTILIIVIPMSYNNMKDAPSLESATEILWSYYRGGQAVVEVLKGLDSIGLNAKGHHPMGTTDQYHQVLLPPHAVSAGLGEQGRTGLFIDFTLGSLVRLAAVSFNSQLPVGSIEIKGIEEFCKRCRYCISKCPPRALPSANYQDYLQTVDQVESKFSFLTNRCFSYFEAHQGCGRCLVHCVLANPDKKKVQQRVDRIEKWYETWIKSGKMDEMYSQYVR